jgi:predicted deacetylase
MSMNAMAQFNQSLSAGFERFSRCRFRLHKLVAPPWEESLAER